ncbi:MULTISPECIES: DUF5610 domain-containing protein [unclassified Neptuniibacter]|uniref:DUF5610 domain-containing protein n=1 Tax=unclassified Neptuniibacter TaxID=2630693 RepID=UPI000C41AA54|nr:MULTISPECIES: DUF5610 domain-containing protein [unclassified Neptuniibacter]MAY40788.1 hypothetical protein [Oceanospirillaceae bacterium]
MQVLLSSQAAYSQVRQETLVTGGFADGKDSSGRSASAADKLVAKLAENIPGMSASEMKGLDANDYSPEKVALRISDFVAQGLEQARSRGASDADLDRMYQAAVSGVEKGFKEATKILKDLDMLSPEISATIDQTKEMTFEALAGLAPTSDSAPMKETSISAAERYAKAESFSMDVMTQEGDKISINFSSEASITASLGAYSDGDSSAVSFGIERNASSSYSFSVEGDLNEEELDALTSLIQDINLIAEDFYSGDVQDAFEQAAELEMDKSQLMNLNVTMTQSASYSAVAAYEQVQQLDNPLGDNGRHLGQMMNNMDRFMGNPALGFLEDSTLFGADLLDNLIHQDVRYKDADEESQSKLDSNFGLLREIMTRFDQDDADD